MKTQEDLSSDRPSNLFYESTGIQKIAGYAAILCAIAAVGMTITWADKHDTDENYLGGLNWSKRVFNWHPVLMVSGMILCLVCSLLTYRIIQLPKMVTKLFHALFHSAAIVCILTGLAAVTTSHNYTDHNKNGTYTANLYSMHSLLGISAMVVYFSNYLMGFIHFLVPGVSLEMKQAFKPNHIFLGVFTLIVGAIAVESGITELTTKLGCIYKVGKFPHVLHYIS